jgi:hypothetical protein
MTDASFRFWIETLASCLSGKFSEWMPDLGEWRNIACHVRRAATFGTGYKAPFSCVPMTFHEHQYQHQHGELACLRKFSRDAQLICTLQNASPFEAERIAGEWFDAQVEKYRQMWREKTGENIRVRGLERKLNWEALT